MTIPSTVELSPDEIARFGSDPVTKTVPPRVLRLAYTAGIADFGENKLQEARDKRAILGDLPIRWSIIGHLQTNKVKYLVRFASEFHALDSFRLAEELNRRLEAEGRDLDVFVQVNTSGEASKYGLHCPTSVRISPAQAARSHDAGDLQRRYRARADLLPFSARSARPCRLYPL